MRAQYLVLLSALVAPTLSQAQSKLSQAPASPSKAELLRSCKVLARLGEAIDRCKQLGISPDNVSERSVATQVRLLTKTGSTPVPAVAAAVTTPNPATSSPFWILRQDQYDQLSYVIPAQSYQVLQGSSVSYTNDRIGKTQSLSTKAFAGVSLYNWRQQPPEGCGSSGGPTNLNGFGVGPFIQSNGNLNQPQTASERSALRFGINSDFHLCNTAAFQQEDWNIMPYGQTDFRGKAGIAGFDALWEPLYVTDKIHLGGRADLMNPLPIDGYFRIIGEANVFHVGDNGLTNFLPNRNYAFLGGTAEVRAVLFENNDKVPPALCGTISFIGTARYLWDAVSRKPINLYGAEIDYKLGGSNPYAVACQKTGPVDASLNGGSTSFALSYNQGTDSVTFVKQNKYTASLKFSY